MQRPYFLASTRGVKFIEEKRLPFAAFDPVYNYTILEKSRANAEPSYLFYEFRDFANLLASDSETEFFNQSSVSP